MVELLADIRRRYASLGNEPAAVQIYYLAMPPALRIDGGLGTHWMLPPVVPLTDRLEVRGEAVKRAIYELYRGSADPSVSPWYEPHVEDAERLRGVREEV